MTLATCHWALCNRYVDAGPDEAFAVVRRLLEPLVRDAADVAAKKKLSVYVVHDCACPSASPI